MDIRTLKRWSRVFISFEDCILMTLVNARAAIETAIQEMLL